MDQFMKTSYANVHRGVHRLSQEATDAFEAARTKVARFMGADERWVLRQDIRDRLAPRPSRIEYEQHFRRIGRNRPRPTQPSCS